MKKALILVLEYGCKPGRKDIEDYHLQVAETAAELGVKGYDVWIMTCGGFTDPVNHPGKSEAFLGFCLLREFGVDPNRIIMEDRSWTTIENLRNAEGILRLLMIKDGLRFDRLMIFCDEDRALAVRTFARGLLGFSGMRIELKTHRFPKSNRRMIIQRYIKTPLQILGWYCPSLERRALARRIARWTAIGQGD